jgi:hypothetical protein
MTNIIFFFKAESVDESTAISRPVQEDKETNQPFSTFKFEACSRTWRSITIN